ncbi:hypothetical protein NIA69_07355 [Gemmiger formicilis]|nr:hypothetical protein [Gemmiger formicilis]
MAQKETSSKSRRWLGLSGAAVLVANLVLNDYCVPAGRRSQPCTRHRRRWRILRRHGVLR